MAPERPDPSAESVGLLALGRRARRRRRRHARVVAHRPQGRQGPHDPSCTEREVRRARPPLGLVSANRPPTDDHDRTLVFGPAVLGAFAFGGGFVLVDRDTDVDVAAESSVFVDDLEVGNCFDGSDGMPPDGETATILGVNVVPCDGRPDSEVFAVVQHPADPDAEYVGDAALFEFAYDECAALSFLAIGAAVRPTLRWCPALACGLGAVR